MTIAPFVSLTLLYVVFLGDLIFSAKKLPQRMATHFRFDLVADGWMKRSSYLAVMILMAIGLPLGAVGFRAIAGRAEPRALALHALAGLPAAGVLFRRTQADRAGKPPGARKTLALVLGIVAAANGGHRAVHDAVGAGKDVKDAAPGSGSGSRASNCSPPS
jgi:hypothetical protein